MPGYSSGSLYLVGAAALRTGPRASYVLGNHPQPQSNVLFCCWGAVLCTVYSDADLYARASVAVQTLAWSSISGLNVMYLFSIISDQPMAGQQRTEKVGHPSSVREYQKKNQRGRKEERKRRHGETMRSLRESSHENTHGAEEPEQDSD